MLKNLEIQINAKRVSVSNAQHNAENGDNLGCLNSLHVRPGTMYVSDYLPFRCAVMNMDKEIETPR